MSNGRFLVSEKNGFAKYLVDEKIANSDNVFDEHFVELVTSELRRDVGEDNLAVAKTFEGSLFTKTIKSVSVAYTRLVQWGWTGYTEVELEPIIVPGNYYPEDATIIKDKDTDPVDFQKLHPGFLASKEERQHHEIEIATIRELQQKIITRLYPYRTYNAAIEAWPEIEEKLNEYLDSLKVDVKYLPQVIDNTEFNNLLDLE